MEEAPRLTGQPVSRRIVLCVEWPHPGDTPPGDTTPAHQQSATEPLVRVRDDGAATSRLIPLLGLELRHRATAESPRLCVGHKPFRSGGPPYLDCSSRPQPGSRTCRSCAVVEATFASNLHHAHTKEAIGGDPAIAQHLRQPNLLYLAAFRDGSVKVGTSTERRLPVRLAEQGAWLARVVAWTPDGVTVRLLEDFVTDRLELPQAISSTRKLAGLVQPKPDDDLSRALDAYRDEVHRLLVGHDTVEPLDDAWDHPRATSGDWTRLHRYPASLAVGAHDLVVSNACGRLVVVHRPGSNDRFVADLKQLYGIELEVGDFGSRELTVQDSLF